VFFVSLLLAEVTNYVVCFSIQRRAAAYIHYNQIDVIYTAK